MDIITININDKLHVSYYETKGKNNVLFNYGEHNILTKNAEHLTIRGILNLLAFFEKDKQYYIDDTGIVLYDKPIIITQDLYLLLEDITADEEIFVDELELILYYQYNELSSYYLEEASINLFSELTNYLQSLKHK